MWLSGPGQGFHAHSSGIIRVTTVDFPEGPRLAGRHLESRQRVAGAWPARGCRCPDPGFPVVVPDNVGVKGKTGPFGLCFRSSGKVMPLRPKACPQLGFKSEGLRPVGPWQGVQATCFCSGSETFLLNQLSCMICAGVGEHHPPSLPTAPMQTLFPPSWGGLFLVLGQSTCLTGRNTQVDRHTGRQTHRCTNAQICRWTRTHTQWTDTDAQTHRWTDTQMHRYTDGQTHRYIGGQMH